MKPDCGCLHPCKDRISNLPEPIRNKVISYLDMEEAIRTSVLSREWRCVTASLPNLEFHQSTFEVKGYDENQFRNIVDRLLVSRARVNVERFELFVYSYDDLATLHINAWVLFAIHNNVCDLRIVVWSDVIIFKFPSCSKWQCSTLVDLHLEGEDMHLEVPPDAVFPILKRCELRYITFNDDSLTKNLFCRCPSILEFTLEMCHVNHYNNQFSISSPSLKILTLSLFTYNHTTEIQINASNLQKIYYDYTTQPIMSSETLCSLLMASFASGYIKLSDFRDSGEYSILFGLRNVVRLEICESYIESIYRHQSTFERLSSCSSLTHLDLKIWRHANVVLTLLKIYNKLVTLRVSFKFYKISADTPNDQQISSDKFMLEHLNTVELVYFRGSKEEMHLVRYLLENAIVLEKMKIMYSDSQKNNATTRMKVSEELVNVIKASPCAKISFT